MLAGLALAAVLAVNTSSAFALTAAENVKACAAEWDGLKTANKVPAGATWPSFEKECIARMNAAATTPAKPAAPAAAVVAPAKPAAPAAVVVAPTKPVAPAAPAAVKTAAPAAAATAPAAGGVVGEQSRIKVCAGEWGVYKASAKRDPAMTWPKFWHECDVRMKAAGK